MRRKPDYKQISLRMNPELHGTIKQAAFAGHISIQQWIVKAVDSFLATNHPKEFPPLTADDACATAIFANILSRSTQMDRGLLKFQLLVDHLNLIKRHRAVNPRTQPMPPAFNEAIDKASVQLDQQLTEALKHYQGSPDRKPRRPKK